jgi:hypothetical protein
LNCVTKLQGVSSFDFRHGQIAVKLDEHFHRTLVLMHRIVRPRADLVPSLESYSQGTAATGRIRAAHRSTWKHGCLDRITRVPLLNGF